LHLPPSCVLCISPHFNLRSFCHSVDIFERFETHVAAEVVIVGAQGTALSQSGPVDKTGV